MAVCDHKDTFDQIEICDNCRNNIVKDILEGQKMVEKKMEKCGWCGIGIDSEEIFCSIECEASWYQEFLNETG